MSFFAKNNALTLGLSAIVIVGVVYLVFFTGQDPIADITADSAASSPSEFLFVSLASQLTTITFDTGVFNDDRFFALVDLTTAITPEEAGREDPFAPLPGVKTAE